MRTATAAILVAAGVLIAGCGGGHERRDAVNQYFDRVDAAQAQVRVQAAPIQKAFAGFSTVRNTKSEQRALIRAHAVLLRTWAKVRRVRPPEDARPLHADLVLLYSMQVDVARALVAMTRFLPRYQAALAPLKPAHATLASDLKDAKGWQKVAAAFERYRLSLAAVNHRLDLLLPPATLRPAFDAEHAALARSVGLCTSIENALAKHDTAKTTAGIRALTGLGNETSVARAQRAQVAAAKEYNARLTRIAALTVKIGRERDRLVGELG